jgi:hypothetical protein
MSQTYRNRFDIKIVQALIGRLWKARLRDYRCLIIYACPSYGSTGSETEDRLI